MKNVVIITDTKELTKEIKAIGAAATRFQDRVQRAALSAMVNHAKYGQTALLNLLIAKMGNGTRVKALIEYIDHWSKADWDAESKTFVHNKKGSFDLEAVTGHWVDFVKPTEASKEFILKAELAKVIKRFEAAMKAEGVNVVATEAEVQALVEAAKA
jgi:hypothetical protein